MVVRETPTGYIAEDTDIEVRFFNITSKNEGIYSFVQAIPRAGDATSIVRINLLSPRAKDELAQMLSDWLSAETVHRIIAKVLELYLSPPQPQQIRLLEHPEPSWLIENFILREAQNILFAPGGAGKSFFALLTAILTHNGLDFLGQTQRAKTLYLDWETDETEIARRATMLVRGLEGIYDQIDTPHYLRMYAPLTNSLDYILETCTRYGYSFLIIDSAACAIGGDINSSEEVVRFFSAIRRINACGITTLIISHVSKAVKKEADPAAPIGSVFFENFPRTSWELKSEWDSEQKKYRMALYCRKSNVGKLAPIGIELIFSSGCIFANKIEADSALAGLNDAITQAVLAMLEERPRTPKEIAEELSAKPATIWRTLQRLKEKGKVINDQRGVWKMARSEFEF